MSFEIRGKLAIIFYLTSPEKRLIVAGDIHGDLDSFNAIRKLFNPDEDILIFLGDYADRGTNSVEVIEGIQDLYKSYPENIIPLRGNHEEFTEEGRPTFSPCTLIREVEIKRGGWKPYYEDLKNNFLDRLPLSAIIPGHTLFVHGGISSFINTQDDLINPNELVRESILWSDPLETKGEYLNPRGAGALFGTDISKEVTKRLNVKFIIRSHEPRKVTKGPVIEHNGRIVTISSTNVYGGKPFILILPFKDLPSSGNEIKKYVHFL